jgi:DNA-binding response OmpR family regulator
MNARLLMIGLDDAHSKVIKEHFQSWSIEEAGASETTDISGQGYNLAIADARDTKDQTLELCTDLRNQSQELPLLVTMERWQASQVQYILELGSTRCLIKSFDTKDLGKAVGALLPQESQPRP